MISYTALISTPGTMHGKVLANPAPNGIKIESVASSRGVIIVDNKRWNKIIENQIKFIDVAKEWMHRWMMENVYKIKIKLENIWIDLIRGIYAPYTFTIWTHCIATAWELPGDSHIVILTITITSLSCCNPQRLTLRSCDTVRKTLKLF